MPVKPSSAPEALQSRVLQSIPSAMFYIPDFITPDEESQILSQIPSNRWISLSRRRLQSVPARLTATNTLLSTSGLPEYLTNPVTQRIHDLGVFAGAPHGINHCLVNEYLPGQGIMPHEDGAAYHPVVATVSLGGSTVLDITDKAGGGNEQRKAWRILQEPRSLLLTTGAAYEETLHGIAEVEEDVDLRAETVVNWNLLGNPDAVVANGGRNVRSTRISLTYRDVLKVSNVGSKIFGKQRA